MAFCKSALLFGGSQRDTDKAFHNETIDGMLLSRRTARILGACYFVAWRVAAYLIEIIGYMQLLPRVLLLQ